MSTMWLLTGQEEVISTLVSQAYGHGNKPLAGAWLQLAIMVLLALCVPISITWVFAGSILSGLGFGPESLTVQAEVFCRWFLISLVPLGLLSAITAWLNAMSCTLPPMATSAAALLISVPANYLLIFGYGSLAGLGFIGSPLSTGIVNWSSLLILLLVIKFWNLHHDTSHKFHSALVFDRKNIGVFLEQALPNFIGMALETLQFQVLAGVVSHLGEVQLATHNALFNLYMILTCFMMGAVRGTSVRVGYTLGAKRIDLAKQTMWVALGALGGMSTVIAAICVIVRSDLGRIFSDDPQVINMVSELMPIVGAGLVIFSLEFTAMGVLFGQGRPLEVTVCAMLGNWLVCIPLAFIFTRVLGWGLPGVWWALTIGYAVCTVLTFILVLRTDWQKCSDDAVKRSSGEEGVAADEVGGDAASVPKETADAAAGSAEEP